MSLFDEINKRTQLPKPRSSAQFETIETSTDDDANPPVVFNRNCKSKNIKVILINIQMYIFIIIRKTLNNFYKIL